MHPITFSCQKLMILFKFVVQIIWWKGLYWQKHNKHSPRSSSAHYSFLKLDGLHCKEIKGTGLLLCTSVLCEATCVLSVATMCSALIQYNPWPLQAAHGSLKNVSLELKAGGHSMISFLKKHLLLKGRAWNTGSKGTWDTQNAFYTSDWQQHYFQTTICIQSSR